jgi:phenylalanyl-tRNA synthetase beta chain
VDVRPGKAWMRVRLALAGQRPINNLVDISNFVMLELGQPLHFYDFDKIKESTIIVRDAREGERITTLDGETRALTPTALVIADVDGPTGLAGLMGGQVSEVVPDTHELVIESACWSGPRIRRMATALGMRSEASSRNEKNLAIGLCDIGASRAARLLEQEGGAVHIPRGFGKTMGFPHIIDITKSDVKRLLGFTVTDDEMMRSLAALGFVVDTMLTPELIELLDLDPADVEDVKSFEVRVPYWRSDVLIAPDVVEELARVLGYERVGLEIPAIAPHDVPSTVFDRERTIAHTLAALGYRELVTLALEPRSTYERFRAAGIDVPEPLAIRNPLSDDQRYLRFSLLPAQLAWLAPRRALADARVFEIAHVFTRSADGTPEETSVVQLLATSEATAAANGGTEPGYLAAAGDALAFVRAVLGRPATIRRATFPGMHPGKTGALVVDEIEVGYVGALDPRLAHAYEIARPAYAVVVFIERLPPPSMPTFVHASKYPAIERDLAVVLDPAVPAAEVAAAARAAGDAAIRDAVVFDEYRGAQISSDKKSLALRVTLRRFDATMTDAEAEAAIAAITQTLRERFGATIRE